MGLLTLKEEVILSALIMLGGKSGGAQIRKVVIEHTRKEIVYGTLYNLLENLIRKGFVITGVGDPVPVQGGRSKTIYKITEEGKSALKETLEMHDNLKKLLPNLETGF